MDETEKFMEELNGAETGIQFKEVIDVDKVFYLDLSIKIMEHGKLEFDETQ